MLNLPQLRQSLADFIVVYPQFAVCPDDTDCEQLICAHRMLTYVDFMKIAHKEIVICKRCFDYVLLRIIVHDDNEYYARGFTDYSNTIAIAAADHVLYDPHWKMQLVDPAAKLLEPTIPEH